jgi:hypothetical protein
VERRRRADELAMRADLHGLEAGLDPAVDAAVGAEG